MLVNLPSSFKMFIKLLLICYLILNKKGQLSYFYFKFSFYQWRFSVLLLLLRLFLFHGIQLKSHK